MFCPKCGSILIPKTEGKKKVFICSNCGYKGKELNHKFSEKINNKKQDIEVVEKGIEEETLPITEAECPKCGNNQAYYWLVQTRAADEAETRFLRCTKCKHTWREYD